MKEYKGVKYVLDKEEIKKDLPKKLEILIDNVKNRGTRKYNSKNRPYDASSPGDYPDYH